MTILQEIHAWSKGLSAWQQDAIARTYANPVLSPADIEDLYALAKAEAGIEDPLKRTPKALEDAQVATRVDPTRLVRLLAIKNLSDVNALAPGASLPIAESGLTVIYGENGAGKSGYSRILKHACRARDQREGILPDARIDPMKAGTPSATFEVSIDGANAEMAWSFGSPAPEPLSEIAIFDTHCARAYIDNHGDFAYRPYGLDILESLVALCGKLRGLAVQEKVANAPSNSAFVAYANAQTATGRALLAIPGATTAGDIEALATLSEADQHRLDHLTSTLAEADPQQKAQALRQRVGRLTELKGRIDLATPLVDDANLAALRDLIEISRTAEAAANLAASDFKATPGQLPGTGGEEWKALFESARAFANTSHPGHSLEKLPAEAACPLCQNPLGHEGSERLARFDAFIQQASEAQARKARADAAAVYKAVQSADLNLQIGEALSDELKQLDAALAEECSTFQTGLTTRQKQALEASGGKVPWDQIGALPNDPRAKLGVYATELVAQATALEAAADEKAKAAMTQEKFELETRRRLGEVKPAVLDAIAKHALCRKLQDCIDGMDTRGISRKSTELSRTMASQEVADALNAELRSLKVHELYVGMKPESPGGKAQFKLTLQLPGGGTPAAVLSEGEQRAIAIASFLAEVTLGKGRGGIVFDDPVSSLDHRRRWEVAERLAVESQQRQVIVFTHDIYFLAILEQKAEAIGAQMTKNYIRKASKGFGVHSQDLPFDVVGTKARVGQLRQMLVDARAAKKDGDDDRLRMVTTTAYGKLRLAWERCVEEVLLNGVVQRFGEGVSTQRLKTVLVTDDDYNIIAAGMKKSSKFEHDAASPVGRLPIPDPDELSADIESLETFREAVEKRNKKGIAARA
ncbi:MAG: AAA family ATPase [Bradyrhizobium sp.]|uniref:AAA family ATPase n=1 Tax=Bradyrhizobium sp. TaxID=376 RepID=UPI003D0BA747